MRDIYQADLERRRRAAPTRTRYLGATAALAMAEPVAESYRQRSRWSSRWQKQLKLKKANAWRRP